MPWSASADDINFRTEFDLSLSSVKTSNAGTGDVNEGTSSRFAQHYSIDLRKELYPYLHLNTGGRFINDTTTASFDEIETERTERTMAPYVDINLRSPVIGANVGFHRVQIQEEVTSLPLTNRFKDDLNVNLKWSPSGLPRFSFYRTQSHFYDDADTVDAIDTLTTLKVGYTAFKKIPLRYTYSSLSTENAITDYESLSQTHVAAVNYSEVFFSRRLLMSTNYKIRQQTTSFSGGSLSASIPLSPSQGIFSLDDTPLDGPALTTLTTLIDGDINTSSGVNIGWSQFSGEERNIGLDFGIETGVDKIYIYVDRNIPSSVLSAFSWDIYTSPDNTDTSTWTPHPNPAGITVDFAVFQNRFEISFDEVTDRYIKVVLSPPSFAALDFNSELENIFVTELQAFVTSTSDTGEDLVTVEHSFGLNLNTRVSEDTTVGYNFFFTLKDIDPDTEKITYSNNVHVNHTFNEIFSASLRAGMDNSESTVGSLTTETVGNTYTALLRAAYLKTFQQTLSFNTTIRTEDEEESSSNTVFLRNSAKLYSGWDAVLDVGYNQSTDKDNTETTSTSIRVGSSIVPNERLSVDLYYTGSEVSGETGASFFSQTYDIQALYHPYKTLSLFANINANIDDKEEDLRLLQHYSANWSPFRDGDLQFSLTYRETLRSADEFQERVIGPGLRWHINRYASADMSLFYLSSKSELITTDVLSYRTSLKMIF